MYEFAGSKSAKLIVTESGKLVARFLQSIACLTRVQISIDFCHKNKEQRIKVTKNACNVAKILTEIVILQNYFRK
jgi:hypothetical protein